MEEKLGFRTTLAELLREAVGQKSVLALESGTIVEGDTFIVRVNDNEVSLNDVIINVNYREE